jgi:sugar/nucleoside kinase (ribokinase family)
MIDSADSSLTLPPEAVIGIGGIGSGIFFELDGGHDLGREESRGAKLLDRADYCKLHIILHYLSVLLKTDLADKPRIIPVGRVGDDPDGDRLKEMMAGVGMETAYVTAVPGERTLFSVCFQYPDGSGGNITTSNDAGATLTPDDILKLENLFGKYTSKGLALAAPEVPLDARTALLELATAKKFFRIASFTTGEIIPAIETGMFRMIDLVGLNADEARVAVGTPADRGSDDGWVNLCAEVLWEFNPGMMISITLGGKGSVACFDGRLEFAHALPAPRVLSTAGSGDAHLAGLIAGLTGRLPLWRDALPMRSRR